MNPDFPKKTPSTFQYQPRQIMIPGAPAASEELSAELQAIADSMNDAAPFCGELNSKKTSGLTVGTDFTPILWPVTDQTMNIGVVAEGDPLNRLVLSKGRGLFKVSWGMDIIVSIDGGGFTFDTGVNGSALNRNSHVFTHVNPQRYQLSHQNLVRLAEGDYVQVLVKLASGSNQISYDGAYLNLQRIA